MSTLNIWIVFKYPKDYPENYAVRRFEYDQPTEELYTARTLSGVRGFIPDGLHRLDRDPTDKPSVVESWI